MNRIMQVWRGDFKDFEKLQKISDKFKDLPGHEICSIDKYDDICELIIIIPQY